MQKMGGDFGAQKDAKWDAQRIPKNAQNGLTPIERMRPEVGPRETRGRPEGDGTLVRTQGSPETLFSHDLYNNKETKKQRNKVEGLKG